MAFGGMTMRVWVLLCVALVACDTGAVEWRPAKSAKEYASTDDAYRIHDPDPSCDQLGAVIVSGNDQLGKVARAAASHGGTHYVVVDEHMTDEYQSNGSGAYYGNQNAGSVSTSSSTRKVRVTDYTRANVYRCPK
jgi:hypothetical protein